MSSITIEVSGSSSSTPSPQFRYWKSNDIYYREGIRGNVLVKDKFKTGGDLKLFLSGSGVKDTDYELLTED